MLVFSSQLPMKTPPFRACSSPAPSPPQLSSGSLIKLLVSRSVERALASYVLVIFDSLRLSCVSCYNNASNSSSSVLPLSSIYTRWGRHCVALFHLVNFAPTIAFGTDCVDSNTIGSILSCPLIVAAGIVGIVCRAFGKGRLIGSLKLGSVLCSPT